MWLESAEPTVLLPEGLPKRHTQAAVEALMPALGYRHHLQHLQSVSQCLTLKAERNATV